MVILAHWTFTSTIYVQSSRSDFCLRRIIYRRQLHEIYWYVSIMNMNLNTHPLQVSPSALVIARTNSRLEAHQKFKSSAIK